MTTSDPHASRRDQDDIRSLVTTLAQQDRLPVNADDVKLLVALRSQVRDLARRVSEEARSC